ncbi:hypothetical protein ACFQ9Z_12730 [Streptomyces sp. NPDC056580]|uniref:hypothetical protein n=1 Tax=Streptomyces sp. NPDC056580 TaxID=3345872 RepID=UPI0036AFAFB7
MVATYFPGRGALGEEPSPEDKAEGEAAKGVLRVGAGDDSFSSVVRDGDAAYFEVPA